MKQLLAAFIFFTRLPFWRISSVPADYFRRIVCYWPVVGWLTGGVMVGVFWIASQFFSTTIAVLLAFSGRLLLTGALHEDGLADFIDGMGGGCSRERVLEIMKDSAIGSYGVIGLILYVALWIASVTTLANYTSTLMVCVLLFVGDCWSKWCASQLINLLPYARKASEAKNKMIYQRMSFSEFLTGLIAALLPFSFIIVFRSREVYLWDFPGWLWLVFLSPVVAMSWVVLYLKKRINGYTGDCCGAAFLLCELFYLLILTGLWRFI